MTLNVFAKLDTTMKWLLQYYLGYCSRACNNMEGSVGNITAMRGG